MYQKYGFTLIELLVVVLIIGILSAVALPEYQSVVAKTRLSEHMQQLLAIRRAQEVYYMANGTYAVSLEDLDVDAKGKCSLHGGDPSLLACPYASVDNISLGAITPESSQILSAFYSGGFPGWGSSVKPDAGSRVYFANSSKPNQIICDYFTGLGKKLCAAL
ncbi:MAG: prepilin-type N-terminal cleavage/methylation domain-containing protein [Elusimicrobia bacterium]|nr:prepilin-type N-terminal cleavage/methylation domain-containing protein [Elusimicrobiota bacterium]MDY6039179.1 prepilin-type N-terminal cleavage/methylation domain-containing protein [Elusimicrobiaceae bacterium]